MGDVVLMGPPGSGKGTQAKLLVESDGWHQLSTGDLFRQHSRIGSELGALAASYMDRGAYVPDDVTVRMVRERLRELPKSTRILFDGFPRTVAQAKSLDLLLSEFGRSVRGVLVLDVGREELTKRLKHRAREESRTDDSPEIIESRYDVFTRETAPVIEHYDRRKLVKHIDGRGTVAEVGARMRAALPDGAGA